MHFQHNVTLLLERIEARCLVELDAGAEIDTGAKWGCSSWAGAIPAASDPHVREGHGERAGAVRAARCPCAGERPQRKGIGRRWQELASQAGRYKAQTAVSVAIGARDE
jgi:hypothetical protein